MRTSIQVRAVSRSWRPHLTERDVLSTGNYRDSRIISVGPRIHWRIVNPSFSRSFGTSWTIAVWTRQWTNPWGVSIRREGTNRGLPLQSKRYMSTTVYVQKLHPPMPRGGINIRLVTQEHNKEFGQIFIREWSCLDLFICVPVKWCTMAFRPVERGRTTQSRRFIWLCPKERTSDRLMQDPFFEFLLATKSLRNYFGNSATYMEATVGTTRPLIELRFSVRGTAAKDESIAIPKCQGDQFTRF